MNLNLLKYWISPQINQGNYATSLFLSTYDRISSFLLKVAIKDVCVYTYI